MEFWIAISAAAGCAICNGVAVILQKSGADKEAKASSLHAGLLFRLMRDLPYMAGIAVDAIAWVLTLVAVHTLPLFVVQPITSFSVVVALCLERFFFKRRIKRANMVAIGVIVVGLLMLASAAAPEASHPVGSALRWIIIFAPVALLAVGAYFVRIHKDYATVALAALSGIGFGGTALVGRMLNFSPRFWEVIPNPLFISLVAYGVVGILLFTIALQRQHATIVNAVMITTETLVPTGIGLAFLGDHPKPGLWPAVIVGCTMATIGVLMLTSRVFVKKRPSPALTDEIEA